MVTQTFIDLKVSTLSMSCFLKEIMVIMNMVAVETVIENDINRDGLK